MQQKIVIQDYEVAVHLGYNVEEQKALQPVHFSVEIGFNDIVNASITDNLEDTIDYVELTKIIKFISTSKRYHLVEHLNHQVMTGLTEYLKSKNIKCELKLFLKKIKVPIDNLKNGIIFSCEANL